MNQHRIISDLNLAIADAMRVYGTILKKGGEQTMDECTKSTPGADIHVQTGGTKIPDDTAEVIILKDNLRRARAELKLKVGAMRDKRKDLESNIASAEEELWEKPEEE